MNIEALVGRPLFSEQGMLEELHAEARETVLNELSAVYGYHMAQQHASEASGLLKEARAAFRKARERLSNADESLANAESARRQAQADRILANGNGKDENVLEAENATNAADAERRIAFSRLREAEARAARLERILATYQAVSAPATPALSAVLASVGNEHKIVA